jgi:hypothetical protein
MAARMPDRAHQVCEGLFGAGTAPRRRRPGIDRRWTLNYGSVATVERSQQSSALGYKTPNEYGAPPSSETQAAFILTEIGPPHRVNVI